MFPFDIDMINAFEAGFISLSKSTLKPMIKYRLSGSDEIIHVQIPSAVAHAIKTKMKGSVQFMKDYPCMIVMIGDDVVSVELPTPKSVNEGDYAFYTPLNITTLTKHVNDVGSEKFLYDGQYVYIVSKPVSKLPIGNFGTIEYAGLNLFHLGRTPSSFVEHGYSGFAYFSSVSDEVRYTGPLVRSMGKLLQITGDDTSGDEKRVLDFSQEGLEHADQFIDVNLRFVNYAGKRLSDAFGYDAIEPLGLPKLMMEHQTYNLGRIPVNVQMHSSAPITYSQAISWLIGLLRKVETLDEYVTIKMCFRLLLTKGNWKRVGREAMQVADIENLREVMKQTPNISLSL